jgi:mannose-1-phosphate guanylyltransferase/phosphomannomutase
MKAVLMAGGFGTRIHPLTINLPKPMIPLVNRPIMAHIVDLLKRHGFDELIFLLYHQPDVIKNYFGDGSEFGLHITYVTPLEDFGTAGAVKAAVRHLDERFLVISGDLLTDFDLGAALRCHERRKAQASIVLTSVPDPLQFGVVITDEQGKITKFLEKPGWGEVFSDTINTGIYILEPQVLDLIPEETNCDWSKDVFPDMLKRGDALYGCSQTGYWADIGNTDAYLETCRAISHGAVNVQVDEDGTGSRGLYIGHDAQISTASIGLQEGMVVLGDNTQVRGRTRLKNSFVGRNCIIEDGAELEDAVVWDNVFIKRGSRIRGAVLCHSVQIGQDVSIDPGAVIAEETRIGDHAYVKSDVKVWPRKVIEAGSIVTNNLIWGEKWRKSLFDGAMVSGLTNVELTPEFMAKLGAAYGSSLPKETLILTGRDALHASRMLKRSFVGGLLSTGVNVSDAQMSSLPLLRFQLASYREGGGVHFRQSPNDPAATDVVFLDAKGIEISSAQAKTIERIFFKETFRRVHYAEPGGLAQTPRLLDYYREKYLAGIDLQLLRLAAPKIVVDLNHSPAAQILPELLIELGCEVVELNSHIIESGGATPQDEARALDQLSRIVVTLEAAAGFRLGPSGERLHLVNDIGVVLTGTEALGTITALCCATEQKGRLVLPVSAPQAVEELARQAGIDVVRTRTDARALSEAAHGADVLLAADNDGRFAFPALHPHCDAMFAIARILELIAGCGLSLRRAQQKIPKRSWRQLQIPCSWELKGGIMRRLNEEYAGADTLCIDGVRIRSGNDYVLLLPDASRPVLHIIADTVEEADAQRLLERHRRQLEAWKSELTVPLERAG